MTRAWIWRQRPHVALILICGLLNVAPLRASWVAQPGTVKVYARKKHRDIPVDPRFLRLLRAEIVDDDDGSFLLQLPLPNASASPSILSEIAEIVEIRNDLDILDFAEMPVDAREPPPVYPAPWAAGPGGLGSREAFVVQFATSPRQAWLREIESTGATIVDAAPQNGYVVIADEIALARSALRLPVQLLRRLQPYHRVSRRIRELGPGSVAIEVSVANVPEKAVAEDYIAANATARIRPPEPGGDRTTFRITIDSSRIPTLARFAAVTWIDIYAPPRPSGEREAHLSIGGAFVSSAGGVLRTALGDHRSWLSASGISNYKTALKLAILDTGLDIGSSTDVHPDLKDSSGNSFVSVVGYTNAGGSNADCYGHGTMVAGIIGGNAGAGVSTQTRDNGSQFLDDADYLMGLGIAPEIPIIVARIFNTYTVGGPDGPPRYDPLPFPQIYSSLLAQGVRIASASFNNAVEARYTADSQVHDKLVRSGTGQNGGQGMAIYFSAGNADDSGDPIQPRVSSPATAKNVITVGGSENYNHCQYENPPFATPATKGPYSDNGNDIWDLSQVGPTLRDGRIKPDLVAPASAIEGPRTRSTDPCPTFGGLGTVIDDLSPVGQQHLWSRGTSFSAPLAAGAGALLYTGFQNRTGAPPLPSLLKAMQISLARDLTNTGHPPDAKQGWGKVDLSNAFPAVLRSAWNNEGSNTLLVAANQTAYLPDGVGTFYRIKDPAQPVKVTLVWTDSPGNPMMATALMNDLDLTVRMQGPGQGRYALGNDFNPATGRSNIYTGTGGVSDSKNNVEQVAFLSADASGATAFAVEVKAKTLMGDGLNSWSPVTNQQNFSLFVDNAVQSCAAFKSDFDVNGSSDIVWRHSASGSNVVWLMGRTSVLGTVALPSQTDLNWRIGAVADFNCDGRADVLWRNYATGDNTIWLMNGASITASVALPPVTDVNWAIAGAGDFNGDDSVDILWRNGATGENTVWLMNGTGVTTAAPLPTISDLNWTIGAVGDFNSDGQADILWRHRVTGSNTMWLMNGTSIGSQVAPPSVTDQNWQIFGAADFDGDGRVDILWRNVVFGQNLLWFMDGSVFKGSLDLPLLTDLGWKIVGPR